MSRAWIEAELRSIERAWHAPGVRSGQGNPYHDAEGKFTGPGGSAGHHGRKRRKSRKRRRLHRLKQELRAEVKRLRKEHATWRKEIARDHSRARSDLKKQHARERKEHVRGEQKERRELERDQAKDRKRLDSERASEHRRIEAHHAKQSAKLDAAEMKAKAKSETHPALAKIAGLRDRLARRTERRKGAADARHADEAATLAGHHEFDRGVLRQSHREGRRDLRQAHRDERQSLRDEQREERAGHLDTMREEREEMREYIRQEAADAGFRHKGKGAARGLPGAGGGDADRVLPRGVDDAGLRVGRAIAPGRTHKAGSAEAILRHCLRSLGLSAAYRRGELTGMQALELLAEVREYARGWLRHEAEQLIRHYGHEVGRGLGSAMRRHVGRFFDRARVFIRESILAGAMALNGPEPLTEEDLLEADRAHREQAGFLERFEAEVRANPPIELAEPSGIALTNPMTAAEFAARAEAYAGAVWVANVNHDRNRTIRSGRYDQERRVHSRPMSDHHACGTCRAESGKGWVPIGTLLPIGDSECLGINCDCHFQYRRSA